MKKGKIHKNTDLDFVIWVFSKRGESYDSKIKGNISPDPHVPYRYSQVPSIEYLHTNTRSLRNSICIRNLSPVTFNLSVVGEASMTDRKIVFREKVILARAIVVSAQTQQCTVSLNYARKRNLIQTLNQMTSITLYWHF
jgi:hypothetical protein